MTLFGKKGPARLSGGGIFLDYASATPLSGEVKKKMERYWSRDFYNPSAVYQEGLEVKSEIDKSRSHLARLLGVTPKGIIFTASGTESDNLAILGTFEKSLKALKKPHIIVSAIEHPAVMAAADEVVRRGGKMSILEVDEEGHVSPETLKKLLTKQTFLVSIGLANSEIGTIQPLSKIGRVVREHRRKHQSIYPYLHTDASQAFNYLDTNLENLQVDLLTIDGSKVYGPKGIGALVMRRGVKIQPIIFGGGQENSLRSGTLSPALVVGFVEALNLANKDRERECKRLEIIRQDFIKVIKGCLPEALINGSVKNHLPNIVSVSLPARRGEPRVISEFVLLKLDREGVMASVGSACSYDEKITGSPVIRALGRQELAESTLRFSFGRNTTTAEAIQAAKIFCLVTKSMVK